MKCPKCGYLGFEQAERCKNCGYSFSLARPNEGQGADLPLRESQPLGPLADFDLGEASRPAAPAARTARRRPDPDLEVRVTPASVSRPVEELPLFGEQPADDDLPLVQASAPMAPLSVRRGAPVASRRPRVTPRAIEEAAPSPLPLPEPARVEVFDPPTSPATDEDAAVALKPRLLAGLLDVALLLSLDAVVIYFTLRVCRLALNEIALLPVVPLALFFALLNGGYLALLTAASGQTIGKMAFGIKVVGEDGERISVPRALLRTAAFLLCTAPVGLGLIPAALGRRRGLHDLLARTHVVRVTAA